MKSAPAPRYKVGKTDAGTPTLAADHPEPWIATVLLHDTLSTGSAAFASGLRDQIAQASRTTSALNASELNAMLAVVHGIGPRDETEALLAAPDRREHECAALAQERCG